jgi:hypothetical protein
MTHKRIALGIGAGLLLVVMGVLTFQALDPPSPPELTLQLREVEQPPHWYNMSPALLETLPASVHKTVVDQLENGTGHGMVPERDWWASRGLLKQAAEREGDGSIDVFAYEGRFYRFLIIIQ